MKTKTKTFDCLKMKDEAQRRRAQLLEEMTPAERLDYYQKAHEALVRRRDAVCGARAQTVVERDSTEHVLARLAKLAGPSDLPPDYSQQHDHYVKGTPRK